MESCLNESDVEDFSNLASKEWNRIIEAAKKHGYREGVEDGADSVFQEGFDKGYKEAFETAFLLGKFKSLLNAMPRDIEHPQNIKKILDKTRRGACRVCATESQDTSDVEKSFTEIVNEQRLHSVSVLQTLYEYFQSHAEHANITESDMLKIQNHIAKLEDNL